jgi:hypothetical protein
VDGHEVRLDASPLTAGNLMLAPSDTCSRVSPRIRRRACLSSLCAARRATGAASAASVVAKSSPGTGSRVRVELDARGSRQMTAQRQ